MCNKKLHVLVVENNPRDRELIRRGLDKLGVDSTTYENGLQAIYTFRKNNFDGVILDVDQHYELFTDAVEELHHKIEVPILLYSTRDNTPISKTDIVILNKEHLHNTLTEFTQLLQRKKDQWIGVA